MLNRLKSALMLTLCAFSLTACATPTEPPPEPAARIVLADRKLPATTCPAPLAVPAFSGATDRDRDLAFAAWLGGPSGRAWLSTNLAAAADCYGKLLAVHAEELRWAEERKKVSD